MANGNGLPIGRPNLFPGIPIPNPTLAEAQAEARRQAQLEALRQDPAALEPPDPLKELLESRQLTDLMAGGIERRHLDEPFMTGAKGKMLSRGEVEEGKATEELSGLFGTAGVTQFLKPYARVPDVAAREAATASSLAKLRTYLETLVFRGKISPNELEHSINMAAQTPRITAHVSDWNDVTWGETLKSIWRGAQEQTRQQAKQSGRHLPFNAPHEPTTKETLKTLLREGPSNTLVGVNRAGTNPSPLFGVPGKASSVGLTGHGYIPRTVVHEGGAHGAQRVALGKNFQPSYFLENLLKGYGKNKYERAARAAEHPWSGRVLQLPNQHRMDPFWRQKLAASDPLMFGP